MREAVQNSKMVLVEIRRVSALVEPALELVAAKSVWDLCCESIRRKSLTKMSCVAPVAH